MTTTQNKGFIKIESGNFAAFVLPENLHKVETKLKRVKPDYKPKAPRELARTFPAYKAGMSTAEYVRAYEKANAMCYPQHMGMRSPYENLNTAPAAEYDPAFPLCAIDENPDFDPATDNPPPVKAKPARRDAKGERIMQLENALHYALAFIENLNGGQYTSGEKYRELLAVLHNSK